MKRMTSEEIINTYIDFFVSKGHLQVKSASLIPKDDPSILWINAGVTPLKKYFDGTVVPKCRRLTSCQKCIRTGDIEEVGVTARHHTFFQMFLSGGNVAFDAAAADLHGGSNLFQLHVVIITHDQHLFFIKG